MGRNSTEIERAVVRTLRDSLEKLQRSTDEVNQAVGDLVSACSSARPSNTLPHLLRAQTSAASLAATLDVLSRFITAAIQPGWNQQYQQDETSPDATLDSSSTAEISASAADPRTASDPLLELPGYESSPAPEPAPAAVEEALHSIASRTAAFEEIAAPQQPAAPQQTIDEQAAPRQIVPEPVQRVAETIPVSTPTVAVQEPQPVVERSVFEVTALPVDQQELHRRANRVAKVSMQDIKMLRPADVRAGKENNDLCARLRDDIERAHKEYERRFHAILDHPVDYFYAWMVEILGEGDPHALGEYPYRSAVSHR